MASKQPAPPCPPGDTTKGEALFKARCTQCHTINKVYFFYFFFKKNKQKFYFNFFFFCFIKKQGGGNKTGPSLYGIIGRKTGSVPKYSYTKANKEASMFFFKTQKIF